MIHDGEKEPRPVDAAFDYVIVGSGAAGAAAARVLSDTGASLAIVEEGPAVDVKEFGDRLWPAFRRMFRGMASQATRGRAIIPVLQGRCLGGSTTVNSAIVHRLPDEVWESWKTEHGLGEALPHDDLHRHWDLIEKELSAARTPEEIWGGNNRLMAEAGGSLKVSTTPTKRYAKDCHGSALCLTGCPYGAKQSMLVSYLPYAEKRGASIFTSAKAEKIRFSGSRARAVEGHFRDALYGRVLAPFRLTARRGVIVAASAIQTPGLLRASGVRSRHLGAHFQAHPGLPVTGIFEDRVALWSGATQGFESHERRRDLGVKIESLGLPPEMIFARAPGVGRRWVQSLAEAPRTALWVAVFRARSEGTVRERFYGTDIHYELDAFDMERVRRGLRFAVELMFAAGARAVLPGVYGLPERLTSPDQAALIESGPTDPSCYSFVASHLFGTARMSLEAGDGVIGTDFGVHGTENLFAIDSSLFPTNIGVNPQHAIMGVAMHAAERIAERRSA